MATVPQPWNDELVSVAAIGQREFQKFSLTHGVYCVPVDEDVRLSETPLDKSGCKKTSPLLLARSRVVPSTTSGSETMQSCHEMLGEQETGVKALYYPCLCASVPLSIVAVADCISRKNFA